jgi:putative MATE family efflux protein
LHKQRDNYTFLTTGPIHRVILTMALPTIVSMLVTNLYNIADTFFVGKLNTESTAAVGVVFTLMFFFQAMGFFFGHGSGNYISAELGARRHDNASRMATTGFVYSFLCGAVFMVLGLIFLRPLSILLGSTPTILPYTERYLSISLFGVPFITSSLTLNNQMRFQGNASKSMFGIVTGAVLNVVLDPLFIFVFDMGVAGAALATVIGQICGFSVLLYMSGQPGNIPIRLKQFTTSRSLLREIFYGGSPSLNRQGLTAFSTLMLNVAAGHYDDAAIAAMTIVNRISMFILAVVIGTGQGFQPFCGFCYGAKLYDRMKRGYWFATKISFWFLVVASVLGFLFSTDVIRMFRDDPAVIEIGIDALRLQLFAWPLGAGIVISNMLLQTCRQPLRANLLAAARSGLFFIPLILILPQLFGLLGVEMCQAVSDVCSFLLAIPIVRGFFRNIA